jgi:hypothetical protein
MTAQRRPGLRGEWCAQQMTYETDISLPPFLRLPCWNRPTCTYIRTLVTCTALRRVRQMTSEIRHGGEERLLVVLLLQAAGCVLLAAATAADSSSRQAAS